MMTVTKQSHSGKAKKQCITICFTLHQRKDETGMRTQPNLKNHIFDNKTFTVKSHLNFVLRRKEALGDHANMLIRKELVQKSYENDTIVCQAGKYKLVCFDRIIIQGNNQRTLKTMNLVST